MEKNKNKKGEKMETTLKKYTLVWLKQTDFKGDCWTLGIVQGFTKKMIKCEDLNRPEVKQSKLRVGNFLPKNVKPLTEEEIKYSSYYTDKQKEIIKRDDLEMQTLPKAFTIMETKESA
tara:strand:- start:597 stop:950 length:354 start_codon:yes stop_codon:yes gene_type:complete